MPLGLSPLRISRVFGRQYSKKSHSVDITKALSPISEPPWLIPERMGIVGIRLIRELDGISCIPLELLPIPEKVIYLSKSLPHSTHLKEAISLN